MGSHAMTTPSTPTLRVMWSPWGLGTAGPWPQGVGDSGPEEHPLSEDSSVEDGGVVRPV